MSSEITCAIITTVGLIMSTLISLFVARSTATNEIKKMRLSWEREDTVSSDDEFAAMASAVATYICCDVLLNHIDAMAKISALRAKEGAELSKHLDELYFAVREERHNQIDPLLTELLNKKREIKSNANPTQTHEPKK